MIIYSETKDVFLDDIVNGVLDEKIESLMMDRLGRRTGASEHQAWQNSLAYMGNIIGRSAIPGDAGIAIEYSIPYTSKRVDLIVTGLNEEGRNAAVIVELKQWSSAEAVQGKDGVVRTAVGKGIHEVTHPSYQAWSYAEAIEDFNADVRDRGVVLSPCACLHNYSAEPPDPLRSDIYREYLERAPMFTKHQGADLKGFLERFIRKGDKGETVFILDRGRLKPSKSLQDVLGSMMRGNREFTLLDTQKVVYEEVLHQARAIAHGGGKRVVIIRGGPGTGKTVLAVNLLSDITSMGMSSQYVSKNAAPRNVYGERLKGQRRGRSRVDKLFVGSGSFCNAEPDVFDVLLADEAHRLNERSGLYQNLGENQVMEIVRASRMSVFFIDEDQRVTLRDIGTVDEIRKHAKEMGAMVTEMELDSQFRCSGSDGYLEWLDDVLQIRETASFEPDDTFDYDFRVFDDPNELRRAIEERNAVNNRSRMVAGYCWNWISEGKDDTDVHDVTIPEFGFGMSWNLGSSQTWAIDPDSVKEIGCIHTCQGLEFDYVGVIIGDDIRYDNGEVITDASKRARTDQSLKGLKKMYPDPEKAAEVADRIIKNTYKVLMSRGMKGCYVYCTDPGMNEHLRNRL